MTEVNRSADGTQHQVTLTAFQMSKYEITNEQYAEFLNAKSIGKIGIDLAGTYPNGNTTSPYCRAVRRNQAAME